jgi:uncharacterized protein (DUF1810 family)
MDPHELERFVLAQQHSWADARAELARGRKASHWMWWIFPQIAGLGRSETAMRYAIGSLDEARSFLAHPVLGPRLVKATNIAAAASGTAEQIFGSIDAVKLRSSLTLFAEAAEGAAKEPFRQALRRFFGGQPDAETLRRLQSPPQH